jgi:hypothetical protein
MQVSTTAIAIETNLFILPPLKTYPFKIPLFHFPLFQRGTERDLFVFLNPPLYSPPLQKGEGGIFPFFKSPLFFSPFIKGKNEDFLLF